MGTWDSCRPQKGQAPFPSIESLPFSCGARPYKRNSSHDKPLESYPHASSPWRGIALRRFQPEALSLAYIALPPSSPHLFEAGRKMSSRRSRISEEAISELVSKLQSLLPEARRRGSGFGSKATEGDGQLHQETQPGGRRPERPPLGPHGDHGQRQCRGRHHPHSPPVVSTFPGISSDNIETGEAGIVQSGGISVRKKQLGIILT
ncbi:Transcription factor bHLH135 [Musa troglodytarum]|uniref:Transcription factor bHLH135 n=1 Tax=Musa troglodytarum TaxID=320322 RepID=A0A9E7FV64_9LILI|nr:Transcription factor bHLH135 [Musa troglodytarum]